MKNIKSKFKDILPKSNLRKQNKDEEDSDYIRKVYPILFKILKKKHTRKKEKDENGKDENGKDKNGKDKLVDVKGKNGQTKADIIKDIYEENARLLNLGWGKYIEEEKSKGKDNTDWKLIYNRDQLSSVYKLDSTPLKCPFCGIDDCTTLDHFLPKKNYLLLSTTPFNLIPCCYTCNMKKGDYDPTEGTGFFNPYLDTSSFDWLSIKDFKLYDSSLQITYKINQLDNQSQKEKIEGAATKLDLLERYGNKANQFILNEKNEIKKYCSSEDEIKKFFKYILDSISKLNLDDDNWLKVLCTFIQEESPVSAEARKRLKKYCSISNRWVCFKNDVRGPERGESLKAYLKYVGNDEEKGVYFLSDEQLSRKIVCISYEIDNVQLEDENDLNVFVPGVIDLSDCKDAGFYIFDSQGCTGNCYKCIGCEYGVIVLKKDV